VLKFACPDHTSTWIGFTADSLLEEDGFELQVPLFEKKLCRVLSKGNAER
jgi:hypothetical protein